MSLGRRGRRRLNGIHVRPGRRRPGSADVRGRRPPRAAPAFQPRDRCYEHTSPAGEEGPRPPRRRRGPAVRGSRVRGSPPVRGGGPSRRSRRRCLRRRSCPQSRAEGKLRPQPLDAGVVVMGCVGARRADRGRGGDCEKGS